MLSFGSKLGWPSSIVALIRGLRTPDLHPVDTSPRVAKQTVLCGRALVEKERKALNLV